MAQLSWRTCHPREENCRAVRVDSKTQVRIIRPVFILFSKVKNILRRQLKVPTEFSDIRINLLLVTRTEI